MNLSRWTALGLIAILATVRPGGGDRAAAQPPEGPDSSPPAVTNVTVTPSSDQLQPGSLDITASINPKALVVPRGPRTGEKLAVSGNRLERTVKLEAGQLMEWQNKYVDALGKANKVLNVDGPERFRALAAPRVAAASPEPIQAGKVTALVPFEGLPALTPDEEQTLIQRSLMITDIKVVEDPVRTTGSGVWTFGRAISQIANTADTGISPSNFVKQWLAHWQQDQVINGFTVPNRKAGIEKLILNDWPRVAGTDDLDLTKSPFRLLAIASRLDLRSNLVLGAERIGDGGAGEARFVFCAVDKAGAPLPFTVIFEYAVKKSDYQAVRDWALRWYALKFKVPGTPEYNAALEALTEQFSGIGADPESPPNRSGLSQLRTNEIALVISPGLIPPVPRRQRVWEIREFRVDVNNSGRLKQVTAKQTPDLAYNDPLAGGDQGVLAQYINQDTDNIVNKRHRTPVAFQPISADDGFLGGSALTPGNLFWNAPNLQNAEARHLFSLGTCNGCHAAETFPRLTQPDNLQDPARIPPHFTHVRPRKAGNPATLSPFLTGKDGTGQPYMLPDPSGQKDPNDPTKVLARPFHDLSDRANDLQGIVEYGGYYELWRLPRQRTH